MTLCLLVINLFLPSFFKGKKGVSVTAGYSAHATAEPTVLPVPHHVETGNHWAEASVQTPLINHQCWAEHFPLQSWHKVVVTESRTYKEWGLKGFCSREEHPPSSMCICGTDWQLGLSSAQTWVGQASRVKTHVLPHMGASHSFRSSTWWRFGIGFSYVPDMGWQEGADEWAMGKPDFLHLKYFGFLCHSNVFIQPEKLKMA